MSNRSVLQLRRAARAVGVPRLLGWFAKDYEGAFAKQLRLACHHGDIVWDVGSNVGHYALKFSQWVGQTGRVFAFEPDQTNLGRLRAACQAARNVEIREFGLSDQSARMRFLQGSDMLHSTSRVLMPGEPIPAGTTEVELRTGDTIIKSGIADIPNVIKIDVEGHELSVLKGMQLALTDRRVRRVLVEVHFGILDSSNRADDPKLIEELLRRSGFKVSWTDPSHILALRRL